jgi:hypothetical protein
MSDETRQKKTTKKYNYQKYNKEERNGLLFPGVKYRPTQESLKITEV